MKRKRLSAEERRESEKERKKQYDTRRVYLGGVWEEWDRLRCKLGQSHATFAQHLLSVHRQHCETCGQCDSEDHEDHEDSLPIPMAADIDSIVYDPTPSKSSCLPGLTRKKDDPTTSTPVAGKIPPRFTLFGDMELEDDDTEYDKEDGDKDRNDDVNNISFPNASWDDLGEEEEDIPTSLNTKNRTNLVFRTTKQEAISENKCLAFESSLLKLLHLAVGTECAKCKEPITFTTSMYATCMMIKWRCSYGGDKHVAGTWSSQPNLLAMKAGNLLVPICHVLSGNSYEKTALFAKFLNMGWVSNANYYRIQEKYIRGAVEDYWQDYRQDLIKDAQTPLVVAGDGRNDSPGYSSQYCTYSLMELATNKILALEVVDSREASDKSVNMEKLGFQRAVHDLQSKAAHPISEIVTDQHVQIKALMKNDDKYKDIEHQFDVWHMNKKFIKKLAQTGKERGNSEILPWISAISTHLWHCASTCEGNGEKLKANWTKVVHHVTNQHQWVDFTGLTSGHCEHPIPLTGTDGDKPWITPDSKAHKALVASVWDKRFMENLPFIKNFRHTGNLEVFHSNLLMYCPKRNAFSYSGYKMRNQLAAIDYNKHSDRPFATHKTTGDARYKDRFSKASGNWSTAPLKVPKTYSYMGDLIMEALNQRELNPGRLDAPAVIPPEDPRRIRPNIAKVPRPLKSELIEKRHSRFSAK